MSDESLGVARGYYDSLPYGWWLCVCVWGGGMDSFMEWNSNEKLTVVVTQEIPPVHTQCHLFQQYRRYMQSSLVVSKILCTFLTCHIPRPHHQLITSQSSSLCIFLHLPLLSTYSRSILSGTALSIKPIQNNTHNYFHTAEYWRILANRMED